ncbi:MAG TPA: hypothetical protein VFQ13_10375 [Anaerolineales bacterium]|nr:hypothetical protein [Anaerolineales bacterium]
MNFFDYTVAPTLLQSGFAETDIQGRVPRRNPRPCALHRFNYAQRRLSDPTPVAVI